MPLHPKFAGRLIQVLDSLDYGDAVSWQACEFDAIFRRMGFDTVIYSHWYHERMADRRKDLAELEVTDRDILVFHLSGYSEYALPLALGARCTRVCVYHNITPDTFFQPGTHIHTHTLKGRAQLDEVVKRFHYFWGDSAYNLEELIGLGAPKERSFVVPIVVEPPARTEASAARESGAWMFLGRVAANKAQHTLVDVFADVRERQPQLAEKLTLIGGFEANDPYYKEIVARIKARGVEKQVTLTGKVSNADVEAHLSRASLFVSTSLHEGFGVPLIEAPLAGLPVAALRNTAVGETMGDAVGAGVGLADSPAALGELIESLLSNPERYASTLRAQQENARRFATHSVYPRVQKALAAMLPDRGHEIAVSIVVCTYNRSDLLSRCLDYLRYQSNQNFEVIVVNGPSTDDTAAVLARYRGRVKVGNNPERNLSKSRNIGIELAAGDVIAFIDDDALPFDDWVETIVREFASRPLTLAAIGGPAYYAGSLKYQVEDIAINRFADVELNVDSACIGRDGWERSLLGTNTCFRASTLRDAKGFDEQFDYMLDESELCFRLQQRNHIVAYCPDLYLRHEFAQSHNRGGRYKYNWFTICKNTAYYIAAYSGLTGSELTDCVTSHLKKNRIAPLEDARANGDLGQQEYETYVAAIRDGERQGLLDAKDFPKTRPLANAREPLLMFAPATATPLIGRDLAPLHVCLLTKEFAGFGASGGIGTLYYHLASELLLMGHAVTVIAPSDSADHKAEYVQGRFRVRYVKRQGSVRHGGAAAGASVNNLNWSISALAAVAALHQEHAVDVVDSALWDTEALALSYVKRDNRPPLVLRLVTPLPIAARINEWSMPPNELRLLCAAEHALIENADAVVPISDAVADSIEEEHKVSRDARWKKCYCGVAYWPFFDSQLDYTSLSEVNGKPFPVPREARVVLFVGRLERRKGVDVLIAAANKFLASAPDAHLVLAGRDVEGWTNLSRKILDRGVQSRVHFLQEVTDEIREKLLHAAHCVVFSSRYESFGLVPLEAFVHGVPVVAANTGAIPEVVADGQAGLLYETENAAQLAEKVTALLDDASLRERLSAGARRAAREFSSRKSAIRTVEIYRELVHARASKGD